MTKQLHLGDRVIRNQPRWVPKALAQYLDNNIGKEGIVVRRDVGKYSGLNLYVVVFDYQINGTVGCYFEDQLTFLESCDHDWGEDRISSGDIIMPTITVGSVVKHKSRWLPNFIATLFDRTINEEGIVVCIEGDAYYVNFYGITPRASIKCKLSDLIYLSECDHDWEFVDDSFDHEFGTEMIHSWVCRKCEATKEVEAGDYDEPSGSES